jgi:hypothetical protein
VYDVTTPRSHKTNKTTKIVHSIYAPVSQEIRVDERRAGPLN